MSKIEEMIKRLCPKGVERVRLDSLLDYEQPTRYIVNSTEYDSKYSIPVLTAGQSFILGYTNEEDGIYKASPQNPTIIFDDFTTGFHWVDFDFKVKSSAMKMLKLKESKKENDFRYIYMAMKTIDYIPTNHTRHWISIYSKFEIPLPPLSIQREIVSVLDSFTTFIDKMKQEVELRKKQMEYYRIFLINPILTDKVSISSFTKILRGRRLTKNMLSEDYTYPVFHGGNEPIGFYKEANREANSVMIINVGASAGTVSFCNSDFWSSDGCFCLQKNDDVLDKYVYYALKNKEKQIMSMVRNAGIPTLDASAVEKVEIPLPSLSTQRSIVSTLDSFEQYISKLERLITLREKQYAYYREKLLTFE